MSAIFKNRTDAAERLAAALIHHKPDCSAVYAIPHSGVLTGSVVAKRLDVPLRVLLTARGPYEVARIHAMYGGSLPDVGAGTVIIVDDGMITGETMERAIAEVRETDPLRIIVAVPQATARAIHRIQPLAEETLVLAEAADGVEDLTASFENPERISEDEAWRLYRGNPVA